MENCTWDIYDDNTRGFLGVGLYVSGVLSVILCCIVLAAFIKSSLLEERSHLMILNHIMGSLARSIMGGFLFSGVSAVAGRWLFSDWNCKMFGFLNQLLTVYMTESITHLCIERYVVAKYIKNGWEMTISRYVLFMSLCCMFSLLYSVPSLFDVGEYSMDYSCSFCTFDIALPTTWDRYLVIGILLLQSVKPVMFMTSMLCWAHQLEKENVNHKDHQYNVALTQSAKNIAIATMFCWTPSFLTSSMVILSQLIFGTLSQPPLMLALISSLGSEIAPAVIALTVIWSNEKIRRATMELLGDSSHNKTS